MIFAIESSCDESAVALLDPQNGTLVEELHSQIDLHRAYGGVVPDLASRSHLEAFLPLLEKLFEREGLAAGFEKVTRIAVTRGPGLAGCLAIGLAYGKSLGLAYGLEVEGINHLRAHAFSPFIPFFLHSGSAWEAEFEKQLPHLGLLVSGGNTLLFRIDRDRRITVLNETCDDAAGEALDKGAKLLGLPYPGGPLIEQYAERGGDPEAFDFPRAMPKRGGDPGPFSFSGLKTSLRYRLEKLSDAALERDFAALCASYQAAVVDQLVQKTSRFLEEGRVRFRSLGLSGGVARNGALRKAFRELAEASALPLLPANSSHCGDNASMIAFAALVDSKGRRQPEEGLSFSPGLSITDEMP